MFSIVQIRRSKTELDSRKENGRYLWSEGGREEHERIHILTKKIVNKGVGASWGWCPKYNGVGTSWGWFPKYKGVGTSWGWFPKYKGVDYINIERNFFLMTKI
jgi:hypothetical protein